jgi:hypothetical protein
VGTGIFQALSVMLLGFASGRGARMSRGQAGVCDLGFGMVTNVFRGAGTMS